MSSDNYTKIKNSNIDVRHCPVVDITRRRSKNDKEKKPMTGHQKALCTLYIILIILIVVTIMFSTYYETSKITQVLTGLSKLIRDAVNSPNWVASYGIYLLAQLLFHLFWAPGLTFWNALIGYFMVNKFEAFCVVYIPSCLSCFLTYFIAKYMFKNWCLKRVLNNKFFKAFFEESIETPWKTSWFVRMMFIPVATKNYLMALLEINFIQYAVPAAVFYIPYLGAMVLVGANLDDFVKVSQENGWSQMNSYEKFQFLFTGFLSVLTVALLVYFAVFTCKKMKQIERAHKEAEDLETEDNKEDQLIIA